MLMNDKYIMENILTLTKSVITLALNGAVESSNEKVLKLFKTSLNNLLEMQENIYKELTNQNIYKIPNVKKTDIAKIITKLKSDN